jgi:transcriptional regulator with XRE-family HTH domain
VSKPAEPSPRIAFDPRAFYSALDATRQNRGLQWKDVAQKAGVSPSTLTRIAQGKRPDIDGFFALVKWAGLDPNDLVHAEEPAVADPAAAAIATLFRADPHLDHGEQEALKNLIAAAYNVILKGRKVQ